MQVVGKTGAAAVRRGIGGSWLGLVGATLALLLIGRIAGPSALLISAGIAGFATSAALVPSVRRLTWSMGLAGRLFVLAAWLFVTIALSLSFIRAGLGHHQLLGAQARGTVLALLLCAAWILAVRIPARASAAYKFAAAVALLEVGRLLAFEMGPQFISYIIWAVCLASAATLRLSKGERRYILP